MITVRSRFATRTTHGYYGTPTYVSWAMMNSRCNNPKDQAYARYGGRGITVCPAWRKFENFLADMGERPIGTTIERLKTDGNYEPGNCKWATRREQNRNRSNTKLITIDGEAKTAAEWSLISGVKACTIFWRITQGQQPRDAVFDRPHRLKTKYQPSSP